MERSGEEEPEYMDLQYRTSLDALWATVGAQGKPECRLDMNTAPGTDGIAGKKLRAIPGDIQVRVLNLILWCGKVPQHLNRAQKKFIPKKTDVTKPDEYRSITVSSIFVRQLHYIPAKRLASLVNLDKRLKEFLTVNGCA